MKTLKTRKVFARIAIFAALNLLFIFGPALASGNVYATPPTSADVATRALQSNPASTYAVVVSPAK